MTSRDARDEVAALAAGARALFARGSPGTRLRTAMAEPGGIDRVLWRSLAEGGLLGIGVPESFGGLGRGHAALGAVLEEAGRVALPVPIAETAIAAVRLEADAWVADADQAELFLVATEHAVELFAADAVRVQSRPRSHCGRRLFALELGRGERLPSPRATAERFSAWMRVANASFLLGISAHLLEETAGYVKTRAQFGRVVGSFQAVQHRLADGHVALEMARPAVRDAERTLDADAPDALAASDVAVILSAQASAVTNEQALQCHGGIGFTEEFDLHLWLARGKSLERAYGPARARRASLALRLFDGLPSKGESRT